MDFLGLNTSSDDSDTEDGNAKEVSEPISIAAKAKSKTLENLEECMCPQASFEAMMETKELSQILSTESYGPSTSTEPMTEKPERAFNFTGKKRKWKTYEEGSNAKSQKTFVSSFCGVETVEFQTHPRINGLLQSSAKCRVPSKLARVFARKGFMVALEWCAADFSHLFLTAYGDNSPISICNAFNGNIVNLKQIHQEAVRCAKWNHSGRAILTGSWDKTAKYFDIEKNIELMTLGHSSHVNCCAVHPVNEDIWVTGSYGSLFSWDVRIGSKGPIREYRGNFTDVRDVAFLFEREEFICCTDLVSRDCSDRSIMVWDFPSGAVLSKQIFQEYYNCICLRLHPQEKSFIAQSSNSKIYEFSAFPPYKMYKQKQFVGHTVGEFSVTCDFSSDGAYVISGSSDGQVYIYDHRSSTLLRKLTMFDRRNPCVQVAWHPLLPTFVVAGSWQGEVQLWE